MTKWQMHFSLSKWKGMHIGARNQNFKYTLKVSELSVMDQERKLGVDSSMKVLTYSSCKVGQFHAQDSLKND